LTYIQKCAADAALGSPEGPATAEQIREVAALGGMVGGGVAGNALSRSGLDSLPPLQGIADRFNASADRLSRRHASMISAAEGPAGVTPELLTREKRINSAVAKANKLHRIGRGLEGIATYRKPLRALGVLGGMLGGGLFAQHIASPHTNTQNV